MPLFLIFIVVPATELFLLLEVGQRIGFWPTLGLIVGTGIVGASLARHQGLGVLRRVQAEMAAGRLPAGSLVDGVLILLAGALLVTPGLLTDGAGLLLLLPPVRAGIKGILRRRFEAGLRSGRVVVMSDIDPDSILDLPPDPPDPPDSPVSPR